MGRGERPKTVFTRGSGAVVKAAIRACAETDERRTIADTDRDRASDLVTSYGIVEGIENCSSFAFVDRKLFAAIIWGYPLAGELVAYEVSCCQSWVGLQYAAAPLPSQ